MPHTVVMFYNANDKRWIEDRIADCVIGQGLPIQLAVIVAWAQWEEMKRRLNAEVARLETRTCGSKRTNGS